ncbi:hypothetical protein Hdeb2414_s0010g00340951 [Helianthus debilis subsp. tardiflorus]
MIRKRGNLGSLRRRSPLPKVTQLKFKIIHSKSAPKPPPPPPPPADETKRVEGGPEVINRKTVEEGVKIITPVEASSAKGVTSSSEPVKLAENIERVKKAIVVEAEKIGEEAENVDDAVNEGIRAQTHQVASTRARVEEVSAFDVQHKEPSLIHPEDTPDDHYYRSYDDSCIGEVHASVWKLKQGDTFYSFATCCEWFMGAFPPPKSITRRNANMSSYIILML